MTSPFAMPAVVCNLGGEMMYILQQRLHAQNIPQAKTRKVISDIVRTMFGSKFISELFKPQEVYTSQSTRQIFDRIAHSSIMRLSEASMDKLYDLMTMGLKYQVVSCRVPQEMLQVVVNHIESIKEMLAPAAPEANLLGETTSHTLQTYGAMTPGEFMLLRQTVCRFLQNKRVKVSLFLQDGIQKNDGTIVVSAKGPVPPHFDVPGTVRFFDDGGNVAETVVVAVPLTADCKPADHSLPCGLGQNLYSREHVQRRQGGVPTMDSSALSQASAGGGAGGAAGGTASQTKRYDTAKQELDLLSTLLGSAAAPPANEFHLNLFPESDIAGGGGGLAGSTDGGGVPTLVFDISATTQSKKELEELVSDIDIGGQRKAASNLLDLMDEALADE